MEVGPYGEKDSYTVHQRCDHCGEEDFRCEKDIKYVIDKKNVRSYIGCYFSCKLCKTMTLLKIKTPFIPGRRIQRSAKGVMVQCDNKECTKVRFLEDTESVTSKTARCCFNIFKWNPFPEQRYFICSCGTTNYLCSSYLEESIQARLKEQDRDKKLQL